jgi:hypothetical protein
LKEIYEDEAGIIYDLAEIEKMKENKKKVRSCKGVNNGFFHDHIHDK